MQTGRDRAYIFGVSSCPAHLPLPYIAVAYHVARILFEHIRLPAASVRHPRVLFSRGRGLFIRVGDQLT